MMNFISLIIVKLILYSTNIIMLFRIVAKPGEANGKCQLLNLKLTCMQVKLPTSSTNWPLSPRTQRFNKQSSTFLSCSSLQCSQHHSHTHGKLLHPLTDLFHNKLHSHLHLLILSSRTPGSSLSMSGQSRNGVPSTPGLSKNNSLSMYAHYPSKNSSPTASGLSKNSSLSLHLATSKAVLLLCPASQRTALGLHLASPRTALSMSSLSKNTCCQESAGFASPNSKSSLTGSAKCSSSLYRPPQPTQCNYISFTKDWQGSCAHK